MIVSGRVDDFTNCEPGFLATSQRMISLKMRFLYHYGLTPEIGPFDQGSLTNVVVYYKFMIQTLISRF